MLHKGSIKLAKNKKYKNPLGTSQTVRKFTLPKEYCKEYFARSKARLEKRQREAEASAKPKDVKLGDIIAGAGAAQSAQEEGLKELNLPGGKTTAAAKKSAAANIMTTSPVVEAAGAPTA